MDLPRRYKPWKPLKMRKRVKTSMLSRIPNTIFRTCKRFFSGLFRPRATTLPLQGHHGLSSFQGHREPSFMGCVIKVDQSKRGWYKTAKKVASKCEDGRFILDGDTGLLQVSGICDSEKVFEMLGKSRRSEVRHFQFGQCSKNLFPSFPPEGKTKKNSSSQPQPQPQPNYYYNPNGPYNMSYLPNHGYAYNQQQPAAYMERSYPSYQGLGYHGYQPYDYLLPYRY